MKRPPMGRLVALLAALLLAMTIVSVRLGVLQVSRGGEYQDLALDQRVRSLVLPATRGQILDREGEAPLALSLEARDIYADPRYVEDPYAVAQELAPALGLKLRLVMKALAEDTSFVYIARQVDLDLASRAARLHLPGIGFLEVSKRYYPAGSLASQVLGFVGTEGAGLSGLEYGYQDLLAGRPGERTLEIDPNGQPIAGGLRVDRPPVPGDDIVTTIDRDLQYQVEVALAQAVKANRAKGGSVIVMDRATGDILAMATYPSFDPNDFGASPEETWRNRTVTDAFEPGSVNKVITAAAAVEERALLLDERLVVPDQIPVGEFTIHDSHPHPPQRMMLGDIVAESSNVGAILVARRLGEERMAEYLSRFGFGQETGLGFPGESAGIVLPLYQWSDTSLATMAYGQGIAVSQLQMAAVYATIANGGVWVQPRLVRGTVDAEGVYHEAPPSATRRVVSEQTARIVTQMLAYAVDYGTGSAARIAGYQVAGKTGTARIPFPDRPGYYEHKHVASFIGFLPASAPRVVIAAMIDQPATIYGGVAAAPLFQQIARYAIQRFGIAPGKPLAPPPHALPLP